MTAESPRLFPDNSNMGDFEKTPEQLLLEFRDGNREVFDVIAGKYKGLVAKIAASFDRGCGNFDDLYQEGLIALYRAVCAYKVGSEAFSSYASKSIRNSMISWTRVNANKVIGNVSIDELPETLLSGTHESSPEEIFLSEQFRAELKKRAMEHLSDYERCVFLLYLQEMTAAEMAECLGKSKKSVENALSRIKAKLTAVGA